MTVQPTGAYDFTYVRYRGRIGQFEFHTPDQGEVATHVTIITGRSQPSAVAVIELTNFLRQLSGKIKQGDPVEWWWDFISAPRKEVLIFRGFVVKVSEGTKLAVEARDEMFNVLKVRRTQAFLNETPDGILRWFLAAAKVKGKLHSPKVRLPLYSARELNASEVAQDLNLAVARQANIDTGDWAHFIDQDGTFVWGPFDGYSRNVAPAPYADFTLEADILSFSPGRHTLGRMVTLPKPNVRHSQLVKIYHPDGLSTQVRTEGVTYLQRPRSLRMDITFQYWPPVKE